MRIKLCCTCKVVLTDENGYRRKKAGKRINQFSAYCRACSTLRERARYKKNPEKLKAYGRAWRLKNYARTVDYEREKKYGISGEEYARLVAVQNGRCAVCSGLPGKFRLSVDHDHATGKIRELLCGNCNTAIGLMKDSPERLRAAAIYLEKHQ